ncbi:hypothetical protein DM02DRAFT_660001 [Periconia macrospinosa]|uniref:Uncharacterized protein n=1 Tax=Periconia macrospinosa TaxID=97972 RepID=A0A2V1DBY7_9PLEO|nr:hypothetical protein DM02DRAFT_660001 [Periconia macrospinosa]
MSSTRFAPSDRGIIAQPYDPCQLFGDGDIYGIGDDITSARLGLTVISIALFINLCVNSTGNGVVILDWTIVIQLVIFIPLYVLWRPIFFYRASRRLANKKPEGHISSNSEAEALTESYISLQSALLTLKDPIRYDRGYDAACDDLRTAVVNFMDSLTSGDRPPPSISLFQASQPRNSMNNLRALRNCYVEKMEDIYSQNEQTTMQLKELVEMTEQQAVKLAGLQRQEHAIRIRVMRDHESLWRHERTSMAITIATWVAYMCAGPWIYFKATNKGRKEGCDVKFRTLIFPISVYNRAYITYLRVLACFGFALVPIGVFAVGSFLYRGVQFRFQVTKPEKISDNSRTALSNDNTTEMRNILEPTKEEIEQLSKKVYEEVENLRRFIYRRIAVPFCICFLVVTAVSVELTIKTNNIDLSESSILSTSQLLPLLVACFTASPVFFHGIVESMNDERKEADEKSFGA